MRILQLLLLLAGSAVLSAVNGRWRAKRKTNEVEEAVEEAVQSGAYRVVRPSTLN